MNDQSSPADAVGITVPFVRIPDRRPDDAPFALMEFLGHPSGVRVIGQSVELGIAPPFEPGYEQLGEKLVARELVFSDVEVSATVGFGAEGGREVGILLRASGDGAGLDSHDGYYAGLFFDEQRVVIGKILSGTWRMLAEIHPRAGVKRSSRLAFSAIGAQLLLRVDGRAVLAVRDHDLTEGSVALRTVATRATYSDIEVVDVS